MTYGWTDRRPPLDFAHVAILNHRFIAFDNCCVSNVLEEVTLLKRQISSTLLDLASSQTLLCHYSALSRINTASAFLARIVIALTLKS